MNFLNDETYVGWNKARVDWMLDKYGKKYFKGKTILELGAGSGALGVEFVKLGANVICLEAREEHIVDGRKLYPSIAWRQEDFEKEGMLGQVVAEIVINFGTLYHLDNWEVFLKRSLQSTGEVMFLETEVMDSTLDEELKVEEHKEYWDQSYSGIGTRPSPSRIERVIEEEGFKYQLIWDPRLNYKDLHVYDWEHKDDKQWRNGQRRFWVVTR